jgi:transcriptional regulator with XRE-family HTH domain
MEEQHQTPGALLALLMRRRGWSAPRLAELAGGVSASSIRSYAADRSTPRPPQALAVAQALGAAEGRTMLDAWGYTDLADGFVEQWPETAPAADQALAEAAGGPMSDHAIVLLRAVTSWVQHVETTRRAEQ